VSLANSILVNTLEATVELRNPTYATLGDVPTTLTEGTQVYVEDEDRVYVEDGT
jgi:3D (Asp-Asp-Asp) domain-containing protein